MFAILMKKSLHIVIYLLEPNKNAIASIYFNEEDNSKKELFNYYLYNFSKSTSEILLPPPKQPV